MKIVPIFFEFSSYKFEPRKRRAVFKYKIGFSNKDPLIFSETVIFSEPFDKSKIPPGLLKNILESLHLMLGISYYKLYCPQKIKTCETLSREQADFWNMLYKKGLGEFFYRNKLDPKKIAMFSFDKKAKKIPYKLEKRNRALVGIGGGKDSIVAAEILKKHKVDITGFVVETGNSYSVLDNLIQKIEIGEIKIERHLDKKLFENYDGAYNGHIPISAVFAFLGYFAAVLYDYSYVIVSNEYSSNFGNVNYLGEEVNHQWSKSAEFEIIFQNYSRQFLSPDITYFSLLRPFYEIRIVEIFSKYERYFPLFSSCNKNFRAEKERPYTLWCGECPKCIFMFILLSAFLPPKKLIGIFGKNLYEDSKLSGIFQDVLGFGKIKPFDCVGTFDEARAALILARKNFKDDVIPKIFLNKIKNPEELIRKVFRTNPASAMPDNFRLLGMHNVLLLGYGKDGKAAENYIKKLFPEIEIGVADKKNGENYLEKQEGYDLAIKTPGMPKNLVQIPYTTSMNLFFSQIKNLTIGITGSKGKSTTASLIYSILKEAGKKVSFLGNIGHPVLERLLKPVDPEEIFVLELSSYQLDDIRYSPNIAVALNLFPEHMNYHGNEEKYYEAKKNIIKFQNPWDYFVYNSQYKNLRKWAKESNGQKISYDNLKNYENSESRLKGVHNRENIKAAIMVAKILKIPNKIIKKSVKEFEPLSHRLELIGEFKGIKFYDDAISTTPESTIAALKSILNIKTIFLGGEDRGYDFSKLEKELRKQKVENIVLFPETGKRILKSRKGFNILETSSMKEAVEFAYKNTALGSVCLLSTASPSYSLWKDFEEKGKNFQYFVKKLSTQ